MLVLQNKYSVGVLTIVVDEIERDRRFAILVWLSVFVLLHYGGGEGLWSWINRFAINISPLAEMVICVAIASCIVFVLGYRLYVVKRFGDRLLVYRTEIYFCSIGIIISKPNAIIRIAELVKCLVAFIFLGGKYSAFDQWILIKLLCHMIP